MKKSTKNRLAKKAMARCNILRRQVYSKFYDVQGMSVEDAKAIIFPYEGAILAQSEWFAATDYFGKDTRSNIETYGYEDTSFILGTLNYISDRFNCQFRLNWTVGILHYESATVDRY
jgi:hypothetical protein